jgi:hypothetical protein
LLNIASAEITIEEVSKEKEKVSIDWLSSLVDSRVQRSTFDIVKS